MLRRNFLAGAAAAAVSPASAQWAMFQASSPYVASAVHFDGATYLSAASLTATNNNFFSFSLWALYVQNGIDHPDWTVDPLGSDNCLFDVHDTGADVGKSTMIVETASHTDFLASESAPGAVSFGVWHHLCGAMDTGASKISMLFCDGVSIGNQVNTGRHLDCPRAIRRFLQFHCPRKVQDHCE